MRFYLITHDKQNVETQTTYDTLRSAYTAYEAIVYDDTVISAMLLVNELGTPLAAFDRRQGIESGGKKIVYDIRTE